MKYNDWLEEWLASCVKPLMKDRTFIKYSWIAREKIIPLLGDYEMKDLEASVLQRFVSGLIEQHAAGTVRGIMTVLKASLKAAVRMNLIEHQYTDCIDGPKVEEKAVECFSKEEQKKIEEYVIQRTRKSKLIGILICLYTGIRIGELFALEWKDVDLKVGTLSISKSCHDGWGERGYHKIIEPPKTKTSKRLIPIPKQLLPYLNKLRKDSTDSYVIYGQGKPISVRSYQRTFERMLQELNIPHKGFHALRHTFATRALECGMDVKTLAEILGHKNPMVTLSRYTHSLMEHKSEMMNKIGRLLQ